MKWAIVYLQWIRTTITGLSLRRLGALFWMLPNKIAISVNKKSLVFKAVFRESLRISVRYLGLRLRLFHISPVGLESVAVGIRSKYENSEGWKSAPNNIIPRLSTDKKFKFKCVNHQISDNSLFKMTCLYVCDKFISRDRILFWQRASSQLSRQLV